MTTLRCNDVELGVRSTGAGEPLVLVHGSWSDGEVWSPIVDPLSASYRVHRYDRRGAGDSDRVAATRRDQEDDLAALIEAVSDEPVHLVGTSFGGSISIGLTCRRPDLVRSLIVHEPALVSLAASQPVFAADLATVGESIGNVLELIERGDPAGAARLFADEVALGPGAWEAMPAELRATMIDTAPSFAVEQRDPDWDAVDEEALAEIDRPTLITWGEDSPPLFAAIVHALGELIPVARTHEIAGAGHAPHETHPDAYVPVVTEFLTTIAIGAGALEPLPG